MMSMGLNRFVGGALLFAAVNCGPPPAPTQHDIPGFGHEKGEPRAPITIVEFVDFGCSACATFALATLPSIERDWIAQGRARIRLIPYDALGTGRAAAAAAECAAQQKNFWPMHDLLFERQKEWLGRRGQRELFEKWGEELGLNVVRFRNCAQSYAVAESLKKNTRVAKARGVPGTPAFLVNGRPIVGALPYADFATALNAAAGTGRTN
jgi:protein-disulfide isomerase